MDARAAARRALPLSARRRLSGRLFRWLRLTWRLSSGVRIRVAHYGDWDIYNEIFVEGVYDDAIEIALRQATTRPIQVVDIGANVGFFALRTIDRARRARIRDDEIAITAVEADQVCADVFQERVLENDLSAVVSLVCGAVGEKQQGSAPFVEAPGLFPHGRLAAATGPREDATTRVAYVDLSRLLAAIPRISLLKCDIEGAELKMIECYRDVLGKTDVAVFELHHTRCDTNRCRQLLRTYGFTCEKIFRQDASHVLIGVWR